jgi:hypothetical protein
LIWNDAASRMLRRSAGIRRARTAEGVTEVAGSAAAVEGGSAWDPVSRLLRSPELKDCGGVPQSFIR